tara:strand:- start:3200 stop:4675 length:1476 start_codon:yes stop_codon:yes gene_type:complete
MAQQGLFTQLPSVDELLQQRNKRATDLQQTLMTNAAQGARDPAKARAVSFLGSALGRALGDSMGGEDEQMAKRKAAIAQQEEMQGKFGQAYTGSSPQHQLELSNKLIQMGYVESGKQLFDQAQAGFTKQKEDKAKLDLKTKEQARRERLIESANKLGLTYTSADLESGSDMDEAAGIIAEREKVTMLAGGNRKTRATMAKQFGKGPEYIKEVLAGKHDNVSDDMFIKALEGREADLVNYKNKDGGIQLYRVDKQGKVWNLATNSWLYPSELGLSAAPQQTQEVVPMLDTITKALVGAEVKNYGELNTKAYKAVEGIYINDQSMDIFDKGIILGKFGEMRLQIAKSLEALGLSSEQADEATANTEAYLAYRGNAVANIIQAFGSGTGLSDQDRKYATAMAGGEIEMSALAVKKILEIERKMYISTIETNNEAVSRMINRTKGTSEEKKKLALSYYIATPPDRLSGKTKQQSVVNKWLTRASQQLSTRQLGAQ